MHPITRDDNANDKQNPSPEVVSQRLVSDPESLNMLHNVPATMLQSTVSFAR